MATSFLTFRKNQQYYTTPRKIIDSLIGFIIGWMGFGFALWWLLQSPLLFAALTAAVLAAVILPIIFGRKWLGSAILIGMACSSLFFLWFNG